MVIVPAAGGIGYTIDYKEEGCSDSTVVFKSSDTWVTIIGNKVSFSRNDKPKDRSTSIRMYVNGVLCNKNIIYVTQKGNCCAQFSAEATNPDTMYDGSGYTGTVGTYKQLECISSVNARPDVTWVNVLSTEGGNIRVSFGENDSTELPRTAVITVTAISDESEECNDSFIIKQNIRNCDCQDIVDVIISRTCNCNDTRDFDISGDITIESNKNTSIQVGTYTISECIKSISVVSSSNWLTIVSNNSTPIIASVTENESTTAPREATITVTVSIEDGTTCTKSFKVTQKAKSCSCSDSLLKVNGRSEAIDSSGGNGIELGSYTVTDVNCLPSVTVSVASITPSGWLSITSNNSTPIIATVTENPGEERTATIKVGGVVNGTDCYRSFTVTQQLPNCDCNSLKIEQIPNN